MSEPEGMPRDPDLTVWPVERWQHTPGTWVNINGVGYGVRTVLESQDGERYAVSFDPPEAALRYARDVARAAAEAILMRQDASNPPPPLPELPPIATVEQVLERQRLVRQRHEQAELRRRHSVQEAQRALDPKTCRGCGVVEGKRFEPRHHPSNCPALVEWLAAQDAP